MVRESPKRSKMQGLRSSKLIHEARLPTQRGEVAGQAGSEWLKLCLYYTEPPTPTPAGTLKPL